MNDRKIIENMFLRRGFCKRFALVAIPFVLTFYMLSLLFGDFKTPRLSSLTDISRCPACYGISLCPELYSDQITLEMGDTWKSMFNAKNIFYGATKFNRRVVMKKLAHDWELKEFDSKMCKTLNLQENCEPKQMLNVTNLDRRMIQMVQYNTSRPDTEPRKGLILCPYAYSLYDLVQPLLGTTRRQYDMLHLWTMLNINPEPIILQLLKKSAGWPVPSYGGVCGRLEVVAYEGEPLSTLTQVAWHKKLKYAMKILAAAMDFTYKHDRFRFYLMDWSLDNIVANENDEISFVDLEDVVVLDKHISPGADLPDWYQRYRRDDIGPGFTFSIDKMCEHHLSDHNLWAACYILAGDEDPYLYPLPNEFVANRADFETLLHDCLNGENRFKSVITLHHLIRNMLMEKDGAEPVS